MSLTSNFFPFFVFSFCLLYKFRAGLIPRASYGRFEFQRHLEMFSPFSVPLLPESFLFVEKIFLKFQNSDLDFHLSISPPPLMKDYHPLWYKNRPLSHPCSLNNKVFLFLRNNLLENEFLFAWRRQQCFPV